MATFEGAVLAQTVAVAKQHKIEPEALLAVVQVESDGKSLEMDSRTPCLLFERHIFYRQLKSLAPSLVEKAVDEGLANETWQPKTQYKDQGTSSKRLALVARARAIHVEAAIRSCSWGVGQTMGFLYEELKFPSAKAMLDYMIIGGVPAQVECMVREIERKNLKPKLNSHDWAGFARVYNGPGYAKNAYDAKMAQAFSRWKTNGIPADLPPPARINVPIGDRPTAPVTPSPAVPPKTTTGVAVVTAGGAVVAARHSVDPQIIALVVFLIVLAGITGIILWKRNRDKGQLGVLTNVATESAPAAEG